MKIMIVLVIKLILYGFIQLRYYLFDFFFFLIRPGGATILCAIEGMIFVRIFTRTEISPQVQRHILLK